MKIGQKVKAKFKPEKPEGFPQTVIEQCLNDRVFKFKYAYDLVTIKFFEPIDKNFPSSVPVNEHDLEIIKEV